MPSKALKKQTPADPRHLLRYLKYQAAGGDDEAMKRVAAEERVSLATVKQSVLMVDGYKKRNTASEMDLAVRDLVISSVPQAKATLQGLLAATELVEQKDLKTGKVKIVTVEDKTTRLEAVKVLNALIAGLQPKGALMEQTIIQTNQTATLTSGETNEERFARLRKRAQEHNALPAEVAAVPEYIDAGEDAEDDEEDEDGDEEDET